MSNVLQRLRIQSRTRTKPKHHRKLMKGLVFKSSHLKRHHHFAANFALSRKKKSKLRHCQKVLKHKKCSDEKRVNEFVHWCGCVGLELHPHLYIGQQGSCHKIGVVATEDISEGECLAVIPRKCLLSCSNSTVSNLVKKDKDLQSVTSSWVPLLIALAAEYSLKACSYWHPYLSLVPNNENCGPPMVWSESDRERLLEGTGVNKLVDGDMEKMESDFTSTVLPFMKRHPEIFRNELHSYQVYKKLVSLVMSYSFTDAGDDRLTSSTMMVPFVDLLNHHSNHHAELNFHRKCLKLMAVRDIRKGEEVMNTYGSLSNATLLHTYGFCEVNNPNDTALIAMDSIHHQYLNSVLDTNTLSLSKRQKRWKKIKSDNLLEDDYCVDCDGDPEQDLLYLVKLLHINESRYESFVTKLREDEPEEMSVELLNKKELSFVTRLAEHCLSLFPESYDSLVGVTDNKLSETRMSEKEKHALHLCIGQQRCLAALHEKVGGAREL